MGVEWFLEYWRSGEEELLPGLWIWETSGYGSEPQKWKSLPRGIERMRRAVGKEKFGKCEQVKSGLRRRNPGRGLGKGTPNGGRRTSRESGCDVCNIIET